MKSNKKKWLSLLLVTVMLLSLMPTLAFAEGEGQAVRCTFPCNAEGAAVSSAHTLFAVSARVAVAV